MYVYVYFLSLGVSDPNTINVRFFFFYEHNKRVNKNVIWTNSISTHFIIEIYLAVYILYISDKNN